MENKKSSKGLVVFLIVLVLLLLGGLGFGVYKYMELDGDYKELSSDSENSTKELNKQIEEAKGTNDYSVFVKKMKEEREKLYNVTDTKNDFNEYLSTHNEKSYTIHLTEDGVLQLQVGNKEIDIAKNVILFRSAFIGSGPYRSLFYVTEEGNVYGANIEGVVSNNDKLVTEKQVKPKQVVSIIPGGSEAVKRDKNGKVIRELGGSAHPFFVDINGNIYSYEYVE